MKVLLDPSVLHAFLRALGAGFLLIALAFWLRLLLPGLRARLAWRWKRGPIAGRVSTAAFAVMFTALGAAFLFGDWLIPQEHLVWFAAAWLGGWLLALLGARLDRRACESGPPRQERCINRPGCGE